jgi:hypothetical protein
MAEEREVLHSDESGELFRDSRGMFFRHADGRLDYLSHPRSMRDREIEFGPPGDQVNVIPECPCEWCSVVRDHFRRDNTPH